MFQLKRVLQHSNQIFRKRFWTFLRLGISLCALPTLGMLYAMGASTDSTHSDPGWAAPLFLLFAFSACVFSGAATHLTLRELEGRPITGGRALLTTLPRLPHLLINSAIAAFVIPFATFFCLVPGIVVGLSLSVLIPVTLCEPLRTSNAFRRCTELTAGFRFLLFGMFAMIGLGYTLFMGLGALFVRPLFLTESAEVILGLLTLTTSALTGFYLLLLCTTTYHELRTLKDGIAQRELHAVFEG